jgi:hypothetical protein
MLLNKALTESDFTSFLIDCLRRVTTSNNRFNML